MDIRGELRFVYDEPYQPTFDTLEYETKDTENKVKETQGPYEESQLRVPETAEEKEKARKAEAFLKRWGV